VGGVPESVQSLESRSTNETLSVMQKKGQLVRRKKRTRSPHREGAADGVLGELLSNLEVYS